MKTLLLLLNFLFFTFACRDKLDRYSHSSIDGRSIKIHFYSSYSLGFIDFIGAKFREAYLAL